LKIGIKPFSKEKKAVENNSKSGSSREDVPFEEELHKIAHSDDSIEPEVLRSAKSVKYPKLNTRMSEEICNDSASTHSTESSPPKTKNRNQVILIKGWNTGKIKKRQKKDVTKKS